MKIYSFSKILALPFLITIGLLVYLTMGQRSDHSIWIFVPVIALVVIYIFHGNIDYWWLKRHPIPLDQRMREWLEGHLPYYQALTPEERETFETRLSLYLEAREFKAVGSKENRDMPFDIRAIIATQAIVITANESDFLLGDMDRIYVYKHPFPSPQHQFLHTVETHIDDGMILLSLEHALPGITHPDQYYNVALHAYAEAFLRIHPAKPYPEVAHLGWESLEKITGFSRDAVLKTIGFEQCEFLVIHLVAFFTQREKYAASLPMEFNELVEIFG